MRYIKAYIKNDIKKIYKEMPNTKTLQQGDTTTLKISFQRVDLLQMSPHLQATTHRT